MSDFVPEPVKKIHQVATGYTDRQPHPAPLVMCRNAIDSEIPGGAKTVMKRALTKGWRVQPTYALGTAIDNKGNPTHLVHSLAARMSCGDRRAVAVWEVKADPNNSHTVPLKGWKLDCVFIWVLGELAPIRVTSARLTEHLESAQSSLA